MYLYACGMQATKTLKLINTRSSQASRACGGRLRALTSAPALVMNRDHQGVILSVCHSGIIARPVQMTTPHVKRSGINPPDSPLSMEFIWQCAALMVRCLGHRLRLVRRPVQSEVLPGDAKAILHITPHRSHSNSTACWTKLELIDLKVH